MIDQPLLMAILISALAHLAILSTPQRWPRFRMGDRPAQAEPIEVTYWMPASRMPHSSMRAKALAPPALPIQPRTQTQVPPAVTKPLSQSPQPLPTVEVKLPQVEHPPPTPLALKALEAYSQLIRDRFQAEFHRASSTFPHSGQVTLMVQISKTGRVQRMMILANESSNDMTLHTLTMAVAQQISQLDPFPQDLQVETLQFKLPIIFESR